MKKLKNQLTAMLNKDKISKRFILLVTMLIIASCKNSPQIEKSTSYTIDLSVKFKKEVNSFMIDTTGKTVAIIMETYKPDKYCKITFNKSEMDYIQKSIRDIDFSNCDTINENVMDGLQYALYLNNGEDKKEIISGTCKQQKPLDKLVIYIVETYKKKQKDDLFKGLKLIIPPNPPEREH